MKFHGTANVFVDRIHLYVRNPERIRHFYTEILGLRVLKASADAVSFTADGITPLITAEQRPDAAAGRHRASGLYHVALLVPTRRDLAAMAAHLIACNYPLVGGADHAVSEALYVADPEGNGIEIYRDRPSDQWEWTEGRVHMPTEALDRNLLNEWDQSDTWRGMDEKTIIGHLHLQVADLKSSEAFYLDGLGFQLVAAYEPAADFISTGGYHHHLGLNTWNSLGILVPGGAHSGLNYFRLVFPSEEKRHAAIERLRKLQASVNESEGRWFVTDPSGIKMELGLIE